MISELKIPNKEHVFLIQEGSEFVGAALRDGCPVVLVRAPASKGPLSRRRVYNSPLLAGSHTDGLHYIASITTDLGRRHIFWGPYDAD